MPYDAENPGEFDPKVGSRPLATPRHTTEVRIERDAAQGMDTRTQRNLGITHPLLRQHLPQFISHALIISRRLEASRDGADNRQEMIEVAVGEPGA